ncbi:MAG TPA: hypothetical protein VFD43_12690, partial [Planctomycetota bacterium]|nr:hypothetical protein [Planctomycetota bacterium]
GGLDWLSDLSIDSAGRPTVAGGTNSGAFPTTTGAAMPDDPGASWDMYVTRLDADGSRLLYSTYWGGPGAQGTSEVALGLGGLLDVTIGGSTTGQFPVTPGAYDTDEPVIFDAVISRLTLLPTGAAKFGDSTPGTAGPLAIEVTEMPAVGAGGFALTCVSAPPSSTHGLLAMSLYPVATPFSVKGIGLWLEPSRIALLVPATSNEDGYSVVTVPIPNDPRLAGLTTCWQFVWAPPGGGYPWWASNALELTLQP